LRGDPSLPCNGDSGGPVILNVDGSARIIGVISYGDEECRDYAVATRVDAYATSFLDSFASVGTVPTGGRCLFGGNCSQGECFAPPDAPLVAYCDAACSATSACPAPLECSETASGSRCRYPEPSPGAFGTSCTGASTCDSALCARVAGTQTSWCSTVCFPEDSNPCPDGYACLDNPDVAEAHVCYPEDARGASGSAAASCAMASATTGFSERGFLIAVAALLMLRRTRRNGASHHLLCRPICDERRAAVPGQLSSWRRARLRDSTALVRTRSCI
jgi:Trypsin